MKKIIVLAASLCLSMVMAVAHPATDAVKTFFAKGGCISIDATFSGGSQSGSLSAVLNKDAILAVVPLSVQEGSEKEDGVLILTTARMSIQIEGKFIESIKNDASGNLVITLKPVADFNDLDFLEALF